LIRFDFDVACFARKVKRLVADNFVGQKRPETFFKNTAE